MNRFAKLSDAGKSLPSTAANWVAVLDRETKLIWTRDSLPCGEVSWMAAQKAMHAVEVCGFKDWQLPTRKQLLSLVDDTRHSPAIDTDFFTCRSSWYWTSTPAAASPGDFAWFVHFYDGHSYWGLQSDGYDVRAVRPSQSLGKLA